MNFSAARRNLPVVDDPLRRPGRRRAIEPADRILERLLVLRCQTGDETAFVELVSRYHARLSYFLRKLLGDAHLADDVLQEVWLDVYRSVARLRDTTAFAAWVYRIARDRAYRQLRRQRPAPQSIARDDDAVAGDAELNGVYCEDEVARVHEALDQLAPEHREVLVLRFLEGMTYDDIARATGSQLGTVRSRLHYAKRALRRALERNDEP